ncbi:hypothetical protein CD133_02120 [Staphylococcus massiliensis CCUG 55927]|uniref:Uncharacterized protein n=1 Tax=Staphylococcus massiliensis S46 TaxID=1229783 RepID=K9AEM8_9STAP|nr:hypothetical protein C273_10782 [Staphylococcus massiliensis S46]POA01331.1 hypothetical protein CD133_02120 [Staphylococcus massiliensis CCUG 55927]
MNQHLMTLFKIIQSCIVSLKRLNLNWMKWIVVLLILESFLLLFQQASNLMFIIKVFIIFFVAIYLYYDDIISLEIKPKGRYISIDDFIYFLATFIVVELLWILTLFFTNMQTYYGQFIIFNAKGQLYQNVFLYGVIKPVIEVTVFIYLLLWKLMRNQLFIGMFIVSLLYTFWLGPTHIVEFFIIFLMNICLTLLFLKSREIMLIYVFQICTHIVYFVAIYT